MRLGVCVYVIREDQVLYLRRGNQAGQTNLQAPADFVNDGELIQSAAFRIVKEATGLRPQDVQACGMIFIRHPAKPDVHFSVWVCRDTAIFPAVAPDGQHAWLPIEPTFSPDIPELDRVWLPHILRQIRFDAHISYHADDRIEYAKIRPKLPLPFPP